MTNFINLSSLAQKHAVSCPGPSLQRNFCVSNSLRSTRAVSTSSRRSSKPMQVLVGKDGLKSQGSPHLDPCDDVLHFATRVPSLKRPAGLVLLLVDARTVSLSFLEQSQRSPRKFRSGGLGRNGNVSWKRPGPLLLAFAGATVASQAQSSNLLRHLAASFGNLPQMSSPQSASLQTVLHSFAGYFCRGNQHAKVAGISVSCWGPPQKCSRQIARAGRMG